MYLINLKTNNTKILLNNIFYRLLKFPNFQS